ncbi:MAG: AsmA-like C-terminal region-containing protein, partial [Alphaproteobacteria bacterium]|nr:AsmA-like C-terminal region-containing protein [Alphaproteobacteria bacterium]
LAPVKAYLGRAPVELRMVLDATAPVARFDFGLIADGVELGDVQNLWGMKAFLTGNGGVYVRLAGKGNSAHEIASNLIGIVNVGAMKGNISAGLLSNVSSILLSRFLSGGGESNVLNCLAARFIVRNGIMADNGILIDSAASTISGQGAINLSNEAVEMALRARTKVVSLNNLIPLIQIGGSLKDLRYSVDAANVVKGVVGAFVSDVDEASWPIPEVQPDPSGGNPCIYTLDHPQKRYSPEGLRSDKLGRAGQIIEELGKSLIGGLFNK